MDRVQDRIPTKREVALLFIVCVFPIHIWAIIMFLYELPAYLRRMPLWDTIGVLAYVQVVALIESILLLFFMIFVCISLPRRFFKDKFVAQGTVILLVTFIFMIPVHFQIALLEYIEWNMILYRVLVVMWVIVYLIGLFGSSVLIRRNPRFESIFIGFVERATILSIFYIGLDLLSLFIIIFRNLV